MKDCLTVGIDFSRLKPEAWAEEAWTEANQIPERHQNNPERRQNNPERRQNNPERHQNNPERHQNNCRFSK